MIFKIVVVLCLILIFATLFMIVYEDNLKVWYRKFHPEPRSPKIRLA